MALCSLPGISVSVFERTSKREGRGSPLDTHVGRLRCATDPGLRRGWASTREDKGPSLLSGAGPTSAQTFVSKAPKGGWGVAPQHWRDAGTNSSPG